jgi:hypothetical protein
MTVKASAFGLVLSCLAGTALAENVCAGAKDLTALQVAAVQQELMVAGLSCNEAGLYNSFVLAYQRDLQASDNALLDYFLRMNVVTGTADYHRYKTKLANLYSLKSLSNKKAYCQSAERAFASALNDKLGLAAFALAQPSANASRSNACGESVTGLAMVAKPTEAAKPVVLGGAVVAGASVTVKDAVAKVEPPALVEANPPAVAKADPPAKQEAPLSETVAPPPAQAQVETPPPVTRNPAPYSYPSYPYVPPPNRGNAYGYGNGGTQTQNPPPPYRSPPPPLRNYRYDARDRYACENYYGRDPNTGGPYRTNDPCYEVYRWYYDRNYYRWYGAQPQQYWRR